MHIFKQSPAVQVSALFIILIIFVIYIVDFNKENCGC